MEDGYVQQQQDMDNSFQFAQAVPIHHIIMPKKQDGRIPDNFTGFGDWEGRPP